MSPNLRISFTSLFLSLVIAGCGGGGSDSTTTAPATGGTNTGGTSTGGTNTGGTGAGGTTTTGTGPAAVPATAQMAMSCVGGANVQCSGDTIIRTENGIALTNSGVQVYAKSTSDLLNPNPDTTKAVGFAPASGGTAEMRITKDAATGVVSSPALLLQNLGLTWDGKSERPQIVEIFMTTSGRALLNADRSISTVALPASSNLAFWDFATKGLNATQINYANNSYFPRTGNPVRCPAGMAAADCKNTEATPIVNTAGDWHTGGTIPDKMEVSRLHSDGDVHAGDGPPDANGNPTQLPNSSGFGIAFPGSKGYRSLVGWGYQYANLGAWISSDTTLLQEWTQQNNEHTLNRRGIVTFGQVTDTAAVPATGTASYRGFVYGWYSADPNKDPEVITGDADITVDFAARQVTLKVANTITYTATGTPVPVTFTATAAMGAAGTNVTNYLTGTVDNGTLKGGLSGRFFGPAAASGTSGNAPAEIGGAFQMNNATSGALAIGGFIGRKQ